MSSEINLQPLPTGTIHLEGFVKWCLPFQEDVKTNAVCVMEQTICCEKFPYQENRGTSSQLISYFRRIGYTLSKLVTVDKTIICLSSCVSFPVSLARILEKSQRCLLFIFLPPSPPPTKLKPSQELNHWTQSQPLLSKVVLFSCPW